MADTTVEQRMAGGMQVKGRLGRLLDVRLLLSGQNRDGKFEIICSIDNMRAYIRRLDPAGRVLLSVEELLKLISQSGIAHGVDQTSIALFINLQASGQPFDGFFNIAHGTFPHDGEDGSIEFHVLPSVNTARYDQSVSGSIDFKQLNLIENCFAGQLIASVRPPGPGKPGKDIFGIELPAKPGNPLALRPGEGVTVSSSGVDFTSTIEGRVICEDGVISVTQNLEIAGDIDYSVGNVDFTGKVVVSGSVLDGFSVSGKLGVEVGADVGSAEIHSNGPVVIKGGVKGRGVARITCSDLAVKYIDEAAIEARGDVVVTKEILQSTVKALGKVEMPNGGLIGGSLVAFKGVNIGTIGSDMGVETKVAAGLAWTDEESIADIQRRVAALGERIRMADVIVAPLLADSATCSRLTVEQKAVVADLVAELRRLRNSLTALNEEREQIQGHRQEGKVGQINVNTAIFPGTQLQFATTWQPVMNALKGPLSIRNDSGKDQIRFVKQFPLTQDDLVGKETMLDI